MHTLDVNNIHKTKTEYSYFAVVYYDFARW